MDASKIESLEELFGRNPTPEDLQDLRMFVWVSRHGSEQLKEQIHQLLAEPDESNPYPRPNRESERTTP